MIKIPNKFDPRQAKAFRDLESAVALERGGLIMVPWVDHFGCCCRLSLIGVGCWIAVNSPWYPTARLFRQAVRGNWATVIENVCIELEKLVAKKKSDSA